MNKCLDTFFGSDQPSAATATTYGSASRRGSSSYGFPLDDIVYYQISGRYKPGELIVDFPEGDCDDFCYSHSHMLNFDDDDINDESKNDNYARKRGTRKRGTRNKNYTSRDSQQYCKSSGGNYSSDHDISHSHSFKSSKSEICRLEEAARVEEVANRQRVNDDNDYNYNEEGKRGDKNKNCTSRDSQQYCKSSTNNYSSDYNVSQSYKSYKSGSRRLGEAARLEEVVNQQRFDDDDYNYNEEGKRGDKNKNCTSRDSQQFYKSSANNASSDNNVSQSHKNSKSGSRRLGETARVEEIANRQRVNDDNDYNYNEEGKRGAKNKNCISRDSQYYLKSSANNSSSDYYVSQSYKNSKSGSRRLGEAARMEELADRQNKPGGKNYRPLVGGFAAAAYEAMRDLHFSDPALNCDSSDESDH